MTEHSQRLRALLAAFGCALAYVFAGRLLASGCAALPLTAGGQSFVLHCILAPLAEELVFRGVVQRLLQPFGPAAAVGIQAVLFAAQHDPAGMAYALGMGLVLGALAQRTRRMEPCMALHILNNLLVFAAG